MDFEKGPALFLYSDGILEALDGDGENTGQAGIADYAVKLSGDQGKAPTAEALALPIIEAAGSQTEDDLTLVCCRRPD